MNPTTSKGSIYAMLAGLAGVVLPAIPPQYQWLGQVATGALAALATYHP